MQLFTRKRLIALPLCAALAIPGTALAKPLFKTGSYTGGDPAGISNAITFKASKSKLTRLRFVIDKAGACSNGVNLTDSQDGYVFPKIKVKDGKFSVTGTFDGETATARFTLRGKLKGTSAWGTIRSKVTLKDGSNSCDSGKLKWKAVRG